MQAQISCPPTFLPRKLTDFRFNFNLTLQSQQNVEDSAWISKRLRKSGIQLHILAVPPDVRLHSLIFSDILVTALIFMTTIHCFNSVKVLPYINRKHFLPFPASTESDFGHLLLRILEEKEFKGKILPATHPYSLRVLLIAQSLIDTLQRDLELEKVSSVAYYGHAQNSKDSATDSWGDWVEKQFEKIIGWRKDVWHLEEFKWEVLVVNNSDPNARCGPGGKIVLHTGLFDHLCDTGISTVIAHEVGHAVAQYSMEWFYYALLNQVHNLIGLHKWVNFMTLDDYKKRIIC